MKSFRALFLLLPLALSIGVGAASCSSQPEQTGASGSGSPSGSGGSAGGAPDASGPDLSEALFDPEHVLDVAIDMAPADWDALRHQYRNIKDLLGPGCQDAPQQNPYTYFPATVTVDGEKLEMSAVRKKGLLGSASASKPSLKVSFDKFVSDREYSGAEGLTLNNSRQDPSLLKTCLAFKLFRDAGVPAPRCNFARVTLNGATLGLYANVEPVTKRFLARHFTDNTGNLYEGTLSDFRPGFTATYDKKTNENDPDRSDLDAVASALLGSDATLEAELEKVVDIDAFTRFWAMETLLAAWDGYANNLNNHFAYHEPTSDKMAFIPWGPDMSFDADDPFNDPSRPQSVSAKGALARRLYENPALSKRYVDRMKEILDVSWKESDILGEIDRMQKVIGPYLGADAPVAAAGADAIKSFVSGRRAAIMSEILPTPPVWPYPEIAGVCMEDTATVSGTFSTTFGTLAQQNPFATGTGTLQLAILPGMSPMAADAVGAAAGYEGSPSGRRQLNVVASFPDGKVRALVFFLDPEIFAGPNDGGYDWQTISAYGVDIPNQGQATLFGLFGEGTFHFDKAEAKDGSAVSGTFSASLIGVPFK